MRTLAALLVVTSFVQIGAFAADTPPPQRKTAIIVENRAGEQFNDKVSVLEDLISSRIAGKGYSVLSRDVIVNALKSYSSAGITVSSHSAIKASGSQSSDRASVSLEAGQSQKDQSAVAAGIDANNDGANVAMGATAVHEETAQAAIAAKARSSMQQDAGKVEVARTDSAHVAATPDTSAVDDALNNNTSALRLAQSLGADFILIPAITSYGTDKKTYNGNGVSTVNVIHTLRVSYKIVEAGMGGAVRGDTVIATRTERQTDGLQSENSDMVNQL